MSYLDTLPENDTERAAYLLMEANRLQAKVNANTFRITELVDKSDRLEIERDFAVQLLMRMYGEEE